MMSKNKWFIVCTCMLLAACSTTRHIPENDALYTGATVTLNAPDLSVREKKVLRNDLVSTTRPRPNSRFLGIPFKLMIWNTLYSKREDSFMGRLRNKLGEPPVLASQVDLNLNAGILDNHLENKGFFTASVTADSTWKNKKASAHYTADAGNQYKITSVEFVSDSSTLTETIRESAANSLLQVGRPYDLDVIKGERERIDAYLKERGFYFFNPDFLLMQVDSTIGQHQVGIRVVVKKDAPEAAHNVYFINNVYIYSNYSLNTARADTSLADAEYFEGYYVIDREKKYKPRLFEQAMQFNKYDVYNRADHNRTLNRLINLNTFKFVKNRFEIMPADTPKLDAYYYLTPFPSKAIRAEIGANTRSNNMNGSQASVGFNHRNFFRGGEQFDIRLFVGTETQFSGTFQGYNTYRAGGEVNLSLPRFVTPFRINPKGGFIPRTNIRLGYEILNRRRLYTINSFNAGLGYLWRESRQKSHEFFPFIITYVRPINITEEYKRDMANLPSLQHVTDTQFILGSTYLYTLNQQVGGIQKINSFYFTGLADVSGNVAGLFVKESNNNQKRLFNLPFSQYLKLDVDGRYYRRLGLRSTWANRLSVGYGLPYGNSDQLPYIKQFFTGGNNSIRAFRSRTLGPGTYRVTPTTSGYLPDQTGDIKLEGNTEYRPHISGPLYGAIFLDAGNVWLKNDNPEKPGAKFSNQFLKELAVGTGVGIRLDIELFVLRLDVAFPIRKPWLPDGQRWVLNEVKFGNKDWRRENLIINLAIGYPF